MTVRFVLASASPARLAVLRRAGLQPDVVVSNVDEDQHTAANPAHTTGELAGLLAALKARDVASRIDGPALILGCDSLLDLDGEPLGKPGSAAAAAERWQRLRGRSATLYTGHCLLDTGSGSQVCDVAATSVRFGDVSDEEIAMYCATGEPAGVAGAFTIDGLGGWFVDGVDGDHHNVIGLSLPLLRRQIVALGHRLPDVGYPAGPAGM